MALGADNDIVVVADSAAVAREAAQQFRRAGYDRLTGYLDDGISSWAWQGKSLNHLPQLTPTSLMHVLGKWHDHVVLDVRADAE